MNLVEIKSVIGPGDEIKTTVLTFGHAIGIVVF
jgi:hypothetical protein